MKASPDAATSMSPGQVIRSARERAGISREKLAVDSGVSTSTIVRLERADRLPNVAALIRITASLSIPAADVLPTPEQVA